MPLTPFPRCTYLPPQGRPRWLPDKPDGWDLLYLSWGWRWYGEQPVPCSMHAGWAYAVVLEGTPQLVIGRTPVRTAPGCVFILHPDCAFGWADRPGQRCRILSWLWRTPPTHSLLVPAAGGYRRFQLGAARLRALRAIHRACTREVAVPDETAFLVLRRARLEVDIGLASATREAEPTDAKYRANLALQYLRQNPGELKPVRKLCEYLQVSPATLRLLVRTHLGRSPQALALEVRMSRACELLRERRYSVKEIAYQLGYRHPNDFSRAFLRRFGRPPRGPAPAAAR